VVVPTNAPPRRPKTDKEAIEQLRLGGIGLVQAPVPGRDGSFPGGALAKAVLSAQWPQLDPGLAFPVKEPLATAQLEVEPLSQGVWLEAALAEGFPGPFLALKPGLVEAAVYDTGQLAVRAPRFGGDDGPLAAELAGIQRLST